MQVNGPYLQVVGTSKVHATRLPSILNVVLLSLLYTLLSKTQMLGATTVTVYMLLQKTLDYTLASVVSHLKSNSSNLNVFVWT